jgi:DNA repair protein RadC
MDLKKEYQNKFSPEKHPSTFWFKDGFDPSIQKKFQIPEIKVSYSNDYKQKYKLKSFNDIYSCFKNCWDYDLLQFQEEVKLMLLDNSNHVLGILDLAKGGLTECVLDVRIIFSTALKCNATGLAIAHNHPSGTLCPSKGDIDATNRIIEIGKYLNIEIQEHFIITSNGGYGIINKLTISEKESFKVKANNQETTNPELSQFTLEDYLRLNKVSLK